MDSTADRDEMRQSERSRLNMDHGFMRSIVKNQRDRDQYDKLVKQKEAEQKFVVKNNVLKSSSIKKEKKPEIPIYVPPHRKSDVDASSSVTKTGEENEILFKLEFEDEFGRVHDIIVRKDDNPFQLAKNLGRKAGLSRSTINALADRLDSEFKSRSTSN